MNSVVVVSLSPAGVKLRLASRGIVRVRLIDNVAVRGTAVNRLTASNVMSRCAVT